MGLVEAIDTQALVLRSVDYLEADRVLTFLTPTLGKMSVMARGARSSRRRFMGALEPYALLRISVRPGRGELAWLGAAEILRPFAAITSSLEKMAAMGAALELVREITAPRNPDTPLFATVVRCLELVDGADGRVEEILLAFKVRVMNLMGLGPNVRGCGRCGKSPGEAQGAFFDPAMGSIVCRACGGGPNLLSGAARALVLQGLGTTWEDAAAAAWSRVDLGAIRATVDHLVAFELRKELKGSRALSKTQELRGDVRRN